MSKDCIICFCPLPVKPVQALACGHLYHTECIEEWFRLANTCPVCRMATKFPAMPRTVAIGRRRCGYFFVKGEKKGRKCTRFLPCNADDRDVYCSMHQTRL
jgi:hypothetical protein